MCIYTHFCFSFFYESERGLFPDTEFVFDLELPPDFIPRNQDNEVEKFELLTANVSIYIEYILPIAVISLTQKTII